ncbi:MAG: four helix bundle protein [Chryseobacterium sp.]|nr:MAG: four helix bundle protein [Chryseobacterium sp.]
MHNFRSLEVWQKAMELTTLYYKCSQAFPKEELFGLTSQSRRSLISIASNIAEGAGRNSDKQFAHFLAIALGSAFEFETQLQIAFNLNYLDESMYTTIIEKSRHIQNMLKKLINNYNK